MGRVFDWSFHNARIRAKIGKLTTSDTYKTVAGNSFSGAMELIDEKPPSDISWPEFSEKKDTLVSAALYKSYEDHLVMVGKYLEGPYRKVFLLSLEQTLIDDIKYLIRRIAGGHQGPDREAANYIALTNSSLTKDFSSAQSFDELALALEDTPFYKPFNLARNTYEQTGIILGFEVALDLNFHNRLDRAISKLPEPDRTVTGRLFRKLCDVKNLSWLLRYRFHYGLSEVEIFNYMLEQNCELKDEKVKELAKLTSVSDFLPAIQDLNIGMFLSTILSASDKEISISDIEDGLAKYVEHILHQALTTSPFGLAPFMVYQWLKVIEQKRFEKIVTGLQLDLPKETIINSLQLYREAAHA